MKLHGIDFPDAVRRIVAMDFPPVDAEEMAYRKAEQARREEHKYRLSLNTARWRWASSKPAKRTCVEVYLREVRGLFRKKPLPEVLRYLPADPFDAKWRGRHPFPAMIAPFSFMPPGQPPDWEDIAGVHLTFLRSSGYGKAPLDNPKITLGRRSEYPIVLRHPGSRDHPGRALIIAEGIETAAAYWHRPAGIWASGTANRLPAMGDFIPRCRPFIDKVYIAVDDDDAGREYSAELAEYIEELWHTRYNRETGFAERVPSELPAILIGPGVAS